MKKNIVICSDGTGNRGGKTRGTNVWRIFNAVDRHDDGIKQITHYDDGVGTHDLRWLRLLGGAFGWGLSRNIRSAYAFLAMNYEPDDRIFLFGFSRGAFTVRSLAGMLNRCGLIKRKALIEAGGRRHKVLNRILNAYRKVKTVDVSEKKSEANKLKCIRQALKIDDLPFRCCPIPIHFIGVWDTVDAVGLPFDEMPLVDPIWRRVRGRRRWKFHDRKLGRHVRHAYQALALDDERKTYYPLIWQHPNDCPQKAEAGGAEKEPKGQIVEQVWFTGVHSNVGGGYSKDAMSLVPLDWMMGKAEACGLRFTDGVRKAYQRDADVHGRLYDSRVGFCALYRYGLRKLYERPENPLPDDVKWSKLLRCEFRKLFKGKKMEPLPTPAIHASVFKRLQRGTDYYATKVIRENEYTVVWTDCGPYAKHQEGTGGVNGVNAVAVSRLRKFEKTRARLYCLSVVWSLFAAVMGFLVCSMCLNPYRGRGVCGGCPSS